MIYKLITLESQDLLIKLLKTFFESLYTKGMQNRKLWAFVNDKNYPHQPPQFFRSKEVPSLKYSILSPSGWWWWDYKPLSLEKDPLAQPRWKRRYCHSKQQKDQKNNPRSLVAAARRRVRTTVVCTRTFIVIYEMKGHIINNGIAKKSRRDTEWNIMQQRRYDLKSRKISREKTCWTFWCNGFLRKKKLDLIKKRNNKVEIINDYCRKPRHNRADVEKKSERQSKARIICEWIQWSLSFE